jgi:outer membrane lipase/esterase
MIMRITINLRRLSRFLGPLAATALAWPALAATPSYSNMYVFGDSLSDTGNISYYFGGQIPQPPYYPGRFSNGLIWVDDLAADLGLSISPSYPGGNNYAWGGAVTGPGGGVLPPYALLDQRDFFLEDHDGVADPDALYVIWGGGNDVLDEDSANAPENLAAIISSLAAAGAVNFLVPNLPNIGLVPLSLQDGSSAVKEQLTLDFNAELAQIIDELSATLPVNIVTLDVFGIFNDILESPGDWGYTNWTDPCYEGPLGIGGPGEVCDDPDAWVFWDGIHPTAHSHQLLADAALDALSPVPLPAALPLFLAALGAVGIRRRRQGS